jgi:hypothetical protein
MLLAALADGRAVDYLSFLDHYIEDQEGDALSSVFLSKLERP